MAIYWVDPYYHSGNGYLSSSTDNSQQGTYSSPFRLDYFYRQSQNTPYSGFLQDGDEIRFKGLSESTFFPSNRTSNAFLTNPSNNNYYGVNTGYSATQFYGSENSANASLIKVKDKRGNYLYIKMQQGNTNLYTQSGNSFWQECLPVLDLTYKPIFFDQRYQLSTQYNSLNLPFFISSNNGQGGNWPTSYNFNNANLSVTITSGWDTETTQNGITILDFRNNGYQPYNIHWGVDNNTSINDNNHRNYLVKWNCPEMIITNNYGCSSYVKGWSVKLKAFKNCMYSPGYDANIFSGVLTNSKTASPSPTDTTAGSVTIEQYGGGGYTYIFNHNAYSNAVINIPIITSMYPGMRIVQNSAYWTGRLSGGTTGTDYQDYVNNYGYELQFKYSSSSYGISVNLDYQSMSASFPIRTTLTLLNDWELYSRNSNTTLSLENSTYGTISSENIGTKQNDNMFSFDTNVYRNTFSYLSPPSNNQGFPPNSSLSSNNYNLFSDSNSILKTLVWSDVPNYTYVKKWTISNGKNIENVEKPPLYIRSTSYTYATPVKIPVLLEPQSGQTVEFLQSIQSGEISHTPVLIYKSSNYSNKITWKLWKELYDTGMIFKDSIELPLYDYSSNNTNITIGLTTDNSAGINVKLRFIGYSISAGYVTDIISPVSVTFSGNSYSATTTIDKSKFKAGLFTNLFVQYVVTKTDNNITHLAFDNITTSAS
jgi:hypothetical protein